MRIAVVYQERKFIVVIPDESSVSELKAEIERVYCALFQSFGPAQSVSEIRTLSGCVLYEGYRVSSVLVDNDTVLATGEEEGNGDSFTHSLPAHTAVSPYALPCFGCNPLGYHSPMITTGVGHVMTSPYNITQSHLTPPRSGRYGVMSLLRSPSARTVGSQCPSPDSIREYTPPSQPRRDNRRVGEEEQKSLEPPTAGEESECPLREFSHSETRDTRQKTLFPSKTASAVAAPSESSEESGERKRKRAPQRRQTAGKKKETDSGRNSSLPHTNSSTSENEKVTESAAKSLLTSNANDNQKSQSDSSEPTSLRPDKVHSLTATVASTTISKGTLSLQRKRKLSEGSVNSSTKRGKRETEKESESQVVSDDSSDWTSTDESEAEQPKSKITSSAVKQSKKRAVAGAVTPKLTPAPKLTPTPSALEKKKKSTSSEQESEKEIKPSLTSAPTPLASTEPKSATKKSVEATDSSASTEQKSALEAQGQGMREDTPAIMKLSSSSSDWTTDEEETVSETQREESSSTAQSKRKKISATTKVTERMKRGTRARKVMGKAGKSANSTRSLARGGKSKDNGSNSERENKSNQNTDAVLGLWSQVSAIPSPTKSYTAQDGRRLKQKRLEDLQNCSKVSREAVKSESQPGDDEDTQASALSHTRTDYSNVGEGKSVLESATLKREKTVISPDEKRGDDDGTRVLSDPSKQLRGGSGETNVSGHSEEVLASNSLISDEESLEILSQPTSADGVTVIKESQELCHSSRSPSPEIPFLSQRGNPSHHPSSTPQQKLQENITLRSTAVSPAIASERKNSDSCIQEETRHESVRENFGSETEKIQREISTKKKKKKKKSKEADKSTTSDNATESSDATVSGLSDASQVHGKKKKSLSSNKTKSDGNETLTETESQLSEGASIVQGKEKKRTKKKKEIMKEKTGPSVNPDSKSELTDRDRGSVTSKMADSQDEPSELINKANQSEEDELQSTTSNTLSAAQNKPSSLEKERVSSEEEMEEESECSVAVSESQLSRGERGKRKQKKRKNKSTPITAQITGASYSVSGSEVAVESISTPVTSRSKSAIATDHSERESEDVCEELNTEDEETDLNSDITLSQSDSTRKRKRKRKHAKEKALTSAVKSRVIFKGEIKGPPLSKGSSQKDSHATRHRNQSDSSLEEDKEEDDEEEEEEEIEEHSSFKKNTNSVSSSPLKQRSKDSFIKPTTIPSSRKLANTVLSPAAKMGQSSRVSPSKLGQKSPQAKGGSGLLSVFSVTETEMSSEESSSERVKPTSIASHEKKPRKFNFLSSLSTHTKGKKFHVARHSTPFARATSSILSSAPSRLSSDAAVKMFSLTNSARRPKPRPTPPKATPTKQKKHIDSLSSSLDDLLGETTGKEGGSSIQSSVSVSDLLADGSLWDT